MSPRDNWKLEEEDRSIPELRLAAAAATGDVLLLVYGHARLETD